MALLFPIFIIKKWFQNLSKFGRILQGHFSIFGSERKICTFLICIEYPGWGSKTLLDEVGVGLIPEIYMKGLHSIAMHQTPSFIAQKSKSGKEKKKCSIGSIPLAHVQSKCGGNVQHVQCLGKYEEAGGFPPALNIFNILSISPVLATFWLNMGPGGIEHIEHFPCFSHS